MANLEAQLLYRNSLLQMNGMIGERKEKGVVSGKAVTPLPPTFGDLIGKFRFNDFRR